MSITKDAEGNNVSTIFVGSSLNLQGVAASDIAPQLLADGDVSFYGHLSGIVNAFNGGGYETQIYGTYANTGEGLIETTEADGSGSPMAVMTVTLANNTSASIAIPVGTIITSANGIQYQVATTPRLSNGWSNASTGIGSSGSYTIASGQSVTVFAQALDDGPSGNLANNALTTVQGFSGLTVSSSFLYAPAYEWTKGTVTLSNSGTAAQKVWIRTDVQGSNGSYQVGLDAANAAFVSTETDNSYGYYLINPGQTVTVPIGSDAVAAGSTAYASTVAEAATAAPANSITSGSLPTGINIVSSSALTIGGIENPAQNGNTSDLGTNAGFLTNAIFGLWMTQEGYNPTEADVNTTNDYVWTSEDLANWEGYVNSARNMGVLNLAPMLSEFETVDFATAALTANVRAGALYSGGVAFDMPGWFFMAREVAYQQSSMSEIRWANQNGVRSSVTDSPYGPNDSSFLADTQKMVFLMEAYDALPSQIVVKDEGVLGYNQIYSATDPNSENEVANWLSTLQLTPTNSESQLEVHTAGVKPDDEMTGVQEYIAVGANATVNPFSVASVYGESSTQVMTVVVSLDAPLGFFTASSGGTISADRLSYTVSGTESQISAALKSLAYTAVTGATGRVNMKTVVTDAAGVITGNTLLQVNDAPSPASAAIDLKVTYGGGQAEIKGTMSASDIATSETSDQLVLSGTLTMTLANGTVYKITDAQETIYSVNGTTYQTALVGNLSTGGLVEFASSGAETTGWTTAGANLLSISGTSTSFSPIDTTAETGTMTGTVQLATATTYALSGNNISVNAAAGTTAVINSAELSILHPYVFGGAANLDFTGGDATVVLNGSGMNGIADITSLDNDTVWLGTAPVLFHPGGYDTLAATPGPGQISNVVIQGGASSDQVQVYLLGKNGGVDYVTTDGIARTIVQAGNSQLDFTGGNDTIMLNGTDATGCAYITSLGNSVVYGPENNFMNFSESASDDHVITGNGPIFIFGTSASHPTGTTFVSSLGGNGSVTYTGGTKALDLDMTRDSGAASLTLGSGASTITVGTGSTRIADGSGTLSLDLTHAVKAVLSVDGSKAGTATILGFDPSTSSATISGTTGSSIVGGSLVVSLTDGKTVTFVGDTNASHAGIILS